MDFKSVKFNGFVFGFGLDRYGSRVGLDFKSVLSNRFGFGFGFSITLRLGWIMDLKYFSDSDLELDLALYGRTRPRTSKCIRLSIKT